MLEPGHTDRFGEYLREVRSQRRLALHTLADQTGISVARLMALENGSGTPNRREIARLAKALHISQEALLERAGHIRMSLD